MILIEQLPVKTAKIHDVASVRMVHALIVKRSFTFPSPARNALHPAKRCQDITYLRMINTINFVNNVVSQTAWSAIITLAQAVSLRCFSLQTWHFVKIAHRVAWIARIHPHA